MGSPSEEFGPYVVYEQIGLGGMATVHRAETQGLAGFSKQIALKRMLPNVAADERLVQSFIREARLASYLRHANVAQTYDLGKVGDTYFIAMELVPGRNLREILKHCALVAGPMPLAIALNIVNQIADALDYAHNLCDESGQPLGIIHRDVSPANVIVSEGGVVKLIDFGIAKASKAASMMTMSGTIKGKFSYMAPESLLGQADARSDLFALGVIAHELLANRPLFQGNDDMDTLNRVRDMPIAPPSRSNPSVPPEIDAIVMTALERDPDRRWQRAAALREALTMETKRLGLVVRDAEVIAWIDRAFERTVREESEPSIVISTGTVELARGTGSDDASNARGSEPKVESWNEMKTREVKQMPVVERRMTSAHVVPRKELGSSPRHEARPPGDPAARGNAFTEQTTTVRERADTVLERPAPERAPTIDDVPTRDSATTIVRGSTATFPSAPPPAPIPLGDSHAAPRLPLVAEPTHASPAPLLVADAPARQLPFADASLAQTRVADAASGRLGNFLLAILVLIAAGGAAAVVYFALPHLT